MYKMSFHENEDSEKFGQLNIRMLCTTLRLVLIVIVQR